MRSSPAATLAGWLATVTAAAGVGGLIDSGAWVGPSLLTAASGVTAAAVARRFAPWRWLVVLAGLAGVAVAVTGLFGSAQAWVGLIPTPASADTVRALLTDGASDAAELAAPVPATPGIVALCAAGIGVLAVTVDAVAVTWAAPAPAGLALLAGYLVPAAVEPGSWSPLAFLLAAAGYLLLLVAGARADAGGQPARGAGLGPSATVLAASAVALAAVTPALVPPLPEGSLPFGWGTGGPGRAATTVSVDNPILSLQADLVRPDDTTVLTYVTDDPTPSYLRVVGLDEFDGAIWAPRRLQVPDSQRVDNGMPHPVGLTDAVPVRTVHTRVQVAGAVEQRWLPLPYVPARVTAGGTWLYDVDSGNVFSPERTAGGVRYAVESLDRSPTPAQLRAAGPPPAGLEGALTLPEPVRATVRPTARAVVGDAATAYDQAVRLQEWLRDPAVFRYDEHAPSGTGASAVDDFLTRRSGFCVHFASTMAVMARSLGIPARVAVGFTPGEPAGQGAWRVSAHDAHAWPELYFTGVGWVPFEPTPAARTGAPPGYTEPAGGAEAPTPGAAEPRPRPAATPLGRQVPDLGQQGDPAAGAGGTGSGAAGVPRWVWVGLMAAVVTGAGAMPGLVRVRRRRRRLRQSEARPRDPVVQKDPAAIGPAHPDAAVPQDTPAGAATRAMWTELGDTAVDLGYPWPAHRTPRQKAATLRDAAQLDGPATLALARLTGALERARYAAQAGPAGDVAGDYLTVRRGLLEARPRPVRLRATVWPRSVAAWPRSVGWTGRRARKEGPQKPRS